MTFDSELQEEIVNYFKNRKDFYFHGSHTTYFFKTWEKGKDKFPIDSNRPIGGKYNISAEVDVYKSCIDFGVEISIDMYLWGYQSEETVFQGWVENMDGLKTILKAVGL